MTRVQIKICGVTNVNDARACVELGADFIGLNFYRQSPRYIDAKVARQIVKTLGADGGAIGVFVNENADSIRETASAVGLRYIQLHGNSSPELVRDLAAEFRVIRAFHTHGQFRPEQVSLFTNCDVLIDAHHPHLHGGTGRTCDWQAARAALAYARFLFLSGGLDAQNVGSAIETVAPHAVDVCSGVESAPGAKDHQGIKDFVAAVRNAEQSARASVPH